MAKGTRNQYDDAWILENIGNYDSLKDMLCEYNKCHDDTKYTAFYNHCKYALDILGSRRYPEEEDEFLIKTYPMAGAEKTTALYNRKFGKNKSVDAIRGHCLNLGLNVDKHVRTENMKNGMQKHHDKFCRPEEWKLPRVKDESGKWIDAGIAVYRKAYGDIPKGYVIFHLDRDARNNDISNLIAIPNSYPIRMNKAGFKSKNPTLNLAAIKWCEMTAKIKEYYMPEKIEKCKPIVCLDNGKMYLSIKDAANDTGIDRGNIGMCASGKRMTAGGKRWAFIKGD